MEELSATRFFVMDLVQLVRHLWYWYISVFNSHHKYLNPDLQDCCDYVLLTSVKVDLIVKEICLVVSQNQVESLRFVKLSFCPSIKQYFRSTCMLSGHYFM